MINLHPLYVPNDQHMVLTTIIDDENMTVNILDVTDQPDVFQNHVLPENRCYRIGGRTDLNNPRTVPKYGDRVLRSIYPGAILEPKNPRVENELFEITPLSYYWHGNAFTESRTNVALDIYQFRQDRPELEQFFQVKHPYMDMLKSQIPLLGLHLDTQDVPAAAAAVNAQFHERMMYKFNNKCFAQKFSQHRTYMVGGIIDEVYHDQKSIQDSKITYVLADFILTRNSEMINAMTAGLTLELLEMNERRQKYLLDHLRAWYDGGIASRIVNKFYKEHAKSYNHQVLWGLFEVVTNELDNTIRTVIGDHK
jgi:hypothetical protein